MIIKLEFDLFYTVIKTPYISENELRKNLYNQLEKWLKEQDYTEKTGTDIGLSYDDTAVIMWLEETKFKEKIEILEKHNWLDKISAYNFDVVLYF